MKVRPILDPKDLKGGCTYLYFHHNDTRSSLDVVRITGKAYGSKFANAWFVDIRQCCSNGSFYDKDTSLMDPNVISNSYNNNSMWKNNHRTRKFLESVIADEDGANDLYLEILSRFKRGKSYANQKSQLKVA